MVVLPRLSHTDLRQLEPAAVPASCVAGHADLSAHAALPLRDGF